MTTPTQTRWHIGGLDRLRLHMATPRYCLSRPTQIRTPSGYPMKKKNYTFLLFHNTSFLSTIQYSYICQSPEIGLVKYHTCPHDEATGELTYFPVLHTLCSGVSPELRAVEIFLQRAIRSGAAAETAQVVTGTDRAPQHNTPPHTHDTHEPPQLVLLCCPALLNVSQVFNHVHATQSETRQSKAATTESTDVCTRWN